MSQSPCRTFSTTLDETAVEFQGLGFYLQVASKESRNKGILCRDSIRVKKLRAEFKSSKVLGFGAQGRAEPGKRRVRTNLYWGMF